MHFFLIYYCFCVFVMKNYLIDQKVVRINLTGSYAPECLLCFSLFQIIITQNV